MNPRSTGVLCLAALISCTDYDLKRGTDETEGSSDTGVYTEDLPFDFGEGQCDEETFADTEVGLTDLCAFEVGGFNPEVEWEYGSFNSIRSTIVVGDLNQDGMPELIANVTSGISLGSTGKLVALHGDGSGVLWELPFASLGYAASPALGDLDGDGSPEIVVAKEYSHSMMGVGDYTIVAYRADSSLMWESAHFTGDDFDYAAAANISDMDHDGLPEIVAGRVILNYDGTTRGIGEWGRGSFGAGPNIGGFTMDEGSASVVADLDLDGVEEVIVGNAMYAPDGHAIWFDLSQDDGYPAIANLDDDPEGEFIVSSYNTVRAVDTDGTIMWGPRTIAAANIMSVAAIGDVDGDGEPEILVAGGDELLCLSADNQVEWSVTVTDETGATGASIFDFEGDGIPEVVYIDEVQMIALDGQTGAIKFYSDQHISDTMYDYPVIADVDADGHAEIVVAHANGNAALSVYGDRDDSWAPARQVWNQHPYSITNIHDDLTVPVNATQNFTTFNNWHAAMDRGSGEGLVDDLEAEILDVCTDDCDAGWLLVQARILNKSEREIPAGVPVALYAKSGNSRVLLESRTTARPVASAWSGEVMTFAVPAEDVQNIDGLRFVADDQGTGGGVISECSETNNDGNWNEPLCE